MGGAGAADVDDQSVALLLHDRRSSTAAEHGSGEIAGDAYAEDDDTMVDASSGWADADIDIGETRFELL